MPLKNTLHVDKLLSNISVKYSNAEYIHDRVSPKVVVKKDSDLYRIYDRNFRLPETGRSDGGKARQHDFAVSTASYVLQWEALKDYVSDNAAQNYDIADLRADTTEELTDKIMQKKEVDCAAMFTTTNWSQGASLAATALWTLQTSASNPIPMFDSAASVINQNSGMMPNFSIMPRQSFIAAKNHTNVLDRVKYTSREMNAAILGGLLDIPEILIPNGQIDSSAEGASESIGSIWTDDFVFIGFKPSRPSPRVPSSTYMFMKNRPAVKRWRDEEREAEAIEVNAQYQFKVIASLTGYYINNAI